MTTPTCIEYHEQLSDLHGLLTVQIISLLMIMELAL